MRAFSNPTTDEKYRRLGFSPEGLSLKLTVEGVSVYAAEHPLKGTGLTFESFSSRRLSQHEVTLPEKCTVEQIAALICLNVNQNHRYAAKAFTLYFAKIGIMPSR